MRRRQNFSKRLNVTLGPSRRITDRRVLSLATAALVQEGACHGIMFRISESAFACQSILGGDDVADVTELARMVTSFLAIPSAADLAALGVELGLATPP